jgi:hypothetical protein
VTDWSDAGFGTDPDGDARRRAELEVARLDPAAIRAAHEAVEDRVLARLHPSPAEVAADLGGQDPTDPHALVRTPYPWGVAWVCACGRWEGVATGLRSAAWCEADYGRHRHDEEAAAGGE